MPDIDSLVHEIVNYGIGEGLTSPEDRTYVTNRILNLLNKDSVSAQTGEGYRPLKLILEGFLEYAEKQGLCGDGGIASKDIFDTSLMDCLLPRHLPSGGDLGPCMQSLLKRPRIGTTA